jgi:hypothetical protein
MMAPAPGLPGGPGSPVGPGSPLGIGLPGARPPVGAGNAKTMMAPAPGLPRPGGAGAPPPAAITPPPAVAAPPPAAITPPLAVAAPPPAMAPFAPASPPAAGYGAPGGARVGADMSGPEEGWTEPEAYQQPAAAAPAGAAGFGQPVSNTPQMRWQPQAHDPADPLARLAAKLPGSAPGTLFGIPLSTLRDQQLERQVLKLAGIALIASVFFPVMLRPLGFAWDMHANFRMVLWPLVAGAAYLIVGLSPAQVQHNVPPVVWRWTPFAVAFLSVGIVGAGVGLDASSVVGSARTFSWGYALLVFGLLSAMNNPQDRWARYVIGGGAAVVTVIGLSMLDGLFAFSHRPVLHVVLNLLTLLVWLVAVACLAFAVPPSKVPQLRSVDALLPVATAVLLGWLAVRAVLFGLVMAVHVSAGMLPLAIHGLVPVFAYFGVLMLTAPKAYDELRRQFGADPQ